MANQASPPSVAVFLSQLPAERRRECGSVRDEVRRRLPAGYEEVISKKANDLAMAVVGQIVATIPVDRWIAIAQAARQR